MAKLVPSDHPASHLNCTNLLLDSHAWPHRGTGLIDIVYGNWNAQHRLYLQSRDASGNAQFTDVAPAAMAEASPIRTVIVADFDNDGCMPPFLACVPAA